MIVTEDFADEPTISDRRATPPGLGRFFVVVFPALTDPAKLCGASSGLVG